MKREIEVGDIVENTDYGVGNHWSEFKAERPGEKGEKGIVLAVNSNYVAMRAISDGKILSRTIDYVKLISKNKGIIINNYVNF